jgi:hypothetical protein
VLAEPRQDVDGGSDRRVTLGWGRDRVYDRKRVIDKRARLFRVAGPCHRLRDDHEGFRPQLIVRNHREDLLSVLEVQAVGRVARGASERFRLPEWVGYRLRGRDVDVVPAARGVALGRILGGPGTAVSSWRSIVFRARAVEAGENLPASIVVRDELCHASCAIDLASMRITWECLNRRGRKIDPDWANRRRLLTAWERLRPQTFTRMWMRGRGCVTGTSQSR